MPVCTAALNDAAAFDKDRRRRCHGRFADSTGSGAIECTVPRPVLAAADTLPPSLLSGPKRAAQTFRHLSIDKNGRRVVHEGRLAFLGEVSDDLRARRQPPVRSSPSLLLAPRHSNASSPEAPWLAPNVLIRTGMNPQRSTPTLIEFRDPAHVRNVQTKVGLTEVDRFNRLEITVAETHAFLDRIFCGAVTRRLGRVGLGHLLNHHGSLKCEATRRSNMGERGHYV